MRRAVLKRSPLFRTLTATAALAAALAISACSVDTDNTPNTKAMKPLSPKIVAEIEQKDMTKTSPILVRIFKEEAELEIWKQDRSGRMALLKSYPICRWSGELGPKIKEGDRQAPEGFYTITPGQMNPRSSYYLSFNMGYPNAYDRSLGRTGSELMVHGDCSSRGCYAMTDEQISEIYGLAREAFFGGQKSFQVQAYPFRMTPTNMARHRNSPHMPFWKMLKQGYDHFEIARREPKVDVCERRYVFNASPADPSARLRAAEACPALAPSELAQAVAQKTAADEMQVATLTGSTAAAPIRSGRDGGMNPVFLAKFRPPGANPESLVTALAPASLPGTVPEYTTPPSERGPTLALASADPSTGIPSGAVAAVPDTGAANAGSIFSGLTRMVGLGGSSEEPSVKAAIRTPASTARPAAPRPAQAAAAAPSPAPVSAARAAAPLPAPKAAPAPVRSETAAAAPASAPARPSALVQSANAEPAPRAAPTQAMAGAQPVLPSSSFANRFSFR